jgi:hypothetical protein
MLIYALKVYIPGIILLIINLNINEIQRKWFCKTHLQINVIKLNVIRFSIFG